MNTFGNPAIDTPNFDGLARMCAVFNNAYNQAPLCGRSRTSFITGYIPEKINVYNLGEHSLVPLLKDPGVECNDPAFTIQARTLNSNALEGQYRYSFNTNVRSANLTIFGRSVRLVQYSYIKRDEGRLSSELCNYEIDPNEFNNLANDPKYKDVVKELS